MDQAWPDPYRERCLWLFISRLEPEGGESPQIGTDASITHEAPCLAVVDHRNITIK
jgi:hypothetical protein